MFVAQHGAHLAAERSEEERSVAKWRERGFGQRNTKKHFSTMRQSFSNLQIKTTAFKSHCRRNSSAGRATES